LSQDLILGKGRRLVILLRGVPGVKKTVTAEAVALENHKPVFSITCGDFGSTPSEVEFSLKDVFRLAHLWDCVLLLDEADVFLSQRPRLGLKRNALVSGSLEISSGTR
jgi:SpoVK/Ycf46/Vps4 family AAA+-type ATPase